MKKEKIAAWCKSVIIVTGGWIPQKGHRALDCVGTGGNTYNVFASLDGVICKVTDIPIYRKAPWCAEYGFAIKCNSNDWLFYNHCVCSFKVGTRVKKGQLIGKIDTVGRQRALRKKWGVSSKGGTYGFTGRHVHLELIAYPGTKDISRVRPTNFLDTRTRLGGQYATRQFKYQGYINQYIYTKTADKPKPKPKPPVTNWRAEYEKAKKELIKTRKVVVNLQAQAETIERDAMELRRVLEQCKEKYKKQTVTLKKVRADNLMDRKRIVSLQEKNHNQNTALVNQKKKIGRLQKQLDMCKEQSPNIFDILIKWVKSKLGK